jgi:hypothetical protein
MRWVISQVALLTTVGMDRKVEIDGLCCWGPKAGVVAMGDLPGDGSLSVLERTGGGK